MHTVGCGGNVTRMFIKNRPFCFGCFMITDVLTNFLFLLLQDMDSNGLLNSLPVGEMVYTILES
jgi:hypothetical protein